MSKQLKSKYELILWHLLITGDEPKISDVKPTITIAECKSSLVNIGLIKIEKRGRANHLVLEDKAWDWMSNRLRSDDFSVQFSKRMTTAIPIFEAFLVRLGHYLRNNEVPLAEFLISDTATMEAQNHGQPENQPSGVPLEIEIRHAYSNILQNSSDFRVRLSQLHQQLDNFPPQIINSTLRSMQQTGQVSLRPMEDPKEIGPEDEQAAIDLGGGDKRYFIYIQQ